MCLSLGKFDLALVDDGYKIIHFSYVEQLGTLTDLIVGGVILRICPKNWPNGQFWK